MNRRVALRPMMLLRFLRWGRDAVVTSALGLCLAHAGTRNHQSNGDRDKHLYSKNRQ